MFDMIIANERRPYYKKLIKIVPFSIFAEIIFTTKFYLSIVLKKSSNKLIFSVSFLAQVININSSSYKCTQVNKLLFHCQERNAFNVFFAT